MEPDVVLPRHQPKSHERVVHPKRLQAPDRGFDTPARPRRKLIAAATLVAALLSGIAVVLTLEALDDRFNSPQDVTRILRLPVLATFAGEG